LLLKEYIFDLNNSRLERSSFRGNPELKDVCYSLPLHRNFKGLVLYG